MNKTVKIILKVFLIMLCAFIAFEIWGAISNAVYVHSQSKKVLEIAESNGGKIWDNYSWAGYNDLWEENFTGIIIIVYSENIEEISSKLDLEFDEWQYDVLPLNKVGLTCGAGVIYYGFDGLIDFRPGKDKENYYVVDIRDNIPFKHNIITFLSNIIPIDQSMYRI